MTRHSLSLPPDFEVPALLSVSGSLIAITLAKGGYALWAIGGMSMLYVLYLAAQCAGASSTSVRSITAANTMIKAGASIACVATAATMVAASAVTSGSAHSDLGQLIKAQTKSVDRPIEISLREIQYCLDQDRKNDQAALNLTFVRLEIKCPIDRGEI